MKCPYRDFQDCIIEKCPACNYEVKTIKTIEGRKYPHWTYEKAIQLGTMWEKEKQVYQFISCNLISNNVQPVPAQKQIVNNTISHKTSVVVNKSIF